MHGISRYRGRQETGTLPGFIASSAVKLMNVAIAPGEVLGPYKILERIGAGGMGEVWRAWDLRLGRPVAIKQLTEQYRNEFLREAQAIAALSHPNICTLYDIGPDYLVMEYIDGKPLEGPLPSSLAVHLIIQVSSALEEAHRKGLLHRDLKPGNILSTASGVAKLLDFGLAKVTSHDISDKTMTVDGVLKGTPGYMSPEQANCQAVDERSDIFSLATVLFELLSGRRPFERDSILATLNAVVHHSPALPEAPLELAQVVLKAMSKSPSDRFQTMSDFRRALEGISAERPANKRPSVAVLPFLNRSGDLTDEYFSDGLTEEIINALAQNSGLRVLARTSVFAFKGKNDDIRRIADLLGASAIVEGSVRRMGTRVRVTADLIQAADGSLLWSHRFDRDMKDVFALQDEISAAIAGALNSKLTPSDEYYIPTPAAYEAYLKARYQHWKLTPESMSLARRYYDDAIADDPRFGKAYCARGDYFLFAAVSASIPAQEAAPLARLDAHRALELHPGLPEAHALLGEIAAAFEYDWAGAAVHFERAMAGLQVPAVVRHIYGFVYLRFLNRPVENLEQQRMSLHEDPLNVRYLNAEANALARLGRFEEAERECHRILEIDANHSLAYTTLSSIWAAQERWDEALSSMERAHATSSFRILTRGALAGILMRTGELERSRGLLRELGDGSAYGTPMGLALAFLYSGDVTTACRWIVKAVEQRYPIPLHSVAGPMNLLRSSPEWPDLARRMNIPGPAWQ